VAHQLEVRVTQQFKDVVLAAGEEVIHADDVVPIVQQAFAKMGAKEARTPCNKDSFSYMH
jgi:hypothetical protein